MADQTLKEQFKLEPDAEDRKAARQLAKLDKKKFAKRIKKALKH